MCTSIIFVLYKSLKTPTIKEYKVESFLLYHEITLDTKHILKDSTKKIQEILDKYDKEGWVLSSTDTTNFGAAFYYYLYFEKTM